MRCVKNVKKNRKEIHTQLNAFATKYSKRYVFLSIFVTSLSNGRPLYETKFKSVINSDLLDSVMAERKVKKT